MKRFKRTYILLGVLAVACIATICVMKYEEHKEQIKNSDEIILELSPDSIETLAWKNESGTLAFHRDEKWLYDGDTAFPVDEEKINERLQLFEQFGVSFVIEDVEDYSQYGLDAPVCTIDLSTGEQSYEVLLGNYSTMDSQRYVSIGDGNVYPVKTDPLEYFEAVLSDMIDDDETPEFTQVSKLRFSGAEAYSIGYEEDSASTCCAEDVYFTSLSGSSLPLDTDRVDSYLNEISCLDLTDYVSYNATEEELKACGLDNPELSISVDYSYKNDDGEETADNFVLNISRDPEEIKAAAEAAAAAESGETQEEEEFTAYARVGQSQIIYSISEDDYKALMAASYNDLRHQELLTADFADVSQIDITLEGVSYTISSQTEDDVRSYSYMDEELDCAALQSAIESLTADSFTDEKPTGKQEIGLDIYLDNENCPQVSIQLYRYDGTSCLAEVDGTPVALVPRTAVVDLIEAVNSIVLNTKA